jgi:diaminopropionate ammonia-lyase
LFFYKRAASAVWYYLNRYGANRPKLVIVEPTASDGILASFKNKGRTNPSGNLKTIMAGLNCGVPSTTAWDILQNAVDAAISVNDNVAKEAMRLLHSPKENDPQIISGESGVGGFAGFIATMQDDNYQNIKNSLGINEHTNVLFYSTEGATDPDSYSDIVNN